ncbi:PMSR-domain-containing protein [Leucogyrophana mollusca]|uniref:PMSR-domain-containing protein n=1 Tax=Leucogyrophana mollusca TaxID=85980 RepID=A0ACB8BQ34_9AGAM|nr:PMSR-domain-containing protein [Leucogyrophana mollusca]
MSAYSSPDMKAPKSSSSIDEKVRNQVDVTLAAGSLDDQGEDEDNQFINTDDPFPEVPNSPVEDNQLTVRAVLVGCILGAVIAASNIYLGLKTGWTFGASLFGSILGFAILKPLSRAAPTYLGGGYFGPKENNVCQSAATSAGSLGLLFTSGFPAAYQLGLLGAHPKDDIGRLITFTICCAFFGLAFTQPLRQFYILKLKLVFPSGVAAAYTIRSLHVGRNAEANARKKTKALIYAFLGAIVLRVVSEYAPGLLWDWHIFYALNRVGWNWIIRAESWGWIWEWTPAFIGVGMLTGINASYSFLGGSFLAWAVVGPIIVTKGEAFGIIADASIPGYMNYMDMTLTDPIHHPSPRYWLLWPGTLMLLCASFAEVACNWRSLYIAMRSACGMLVQRLHPASKGSYEEDVLDPVPHHERVPFWAWSSVLVLSTIVTCVVMGVQFGQNVGVTILAIIFSFLFSFIGCESSGRTNINPVTSIGNASQLIFGGLGKGQQYAVKRGELLNLLILSIFRRACVERASTSGAAEQAGDMIGDLKTTHLLRASPWAVFIAQLYGAIVSIFMSAGLYVVFSTAYPCINDLSYTTCPFPAPDVQAWRAVAVAVSSNTLPIPPSSGFTAIGLGLAAIVSVVAKYTIVPPKYHDFIPNFNAIGIGWIMNVCTYPVAMAFGSTLAFFWRRMFFNNYQMYCFAVAAGFIAGEGLGGIVNAIFTIAGISGAVWPPSPRSPILMLGRLNQLRVALTSLATPALYRKGVDPSLYRTNMTSASQQPEIATFASGCFWGVEHIFLKHYPPSQNKGIIKTSVGYTGGKESSTNPSYREVCTGSTSHAEALKIEFDPTVVSYAELVEFFYRTHDPTTVNRQGGDVGTQYRSAIFTHSDEQLAMAKRVTEEVQAKHFTPKGVKIVTEIIAAGPWYDAEDYHQLYLFNNPSGYQCPTHRLHW